MNAFRLKLIALVFITSLFLSSAFAGGVNHPEKVRLLLEAEYQFVAVCKVEKGDGSEKSGSIVKPVETFLGNEGKVPRWRFLWGAKFFEVYEGEAILYAIGKSDDPAGGGVLICPIRKRIDEKESYFELNGGLRVTMRDLRRFKRERAPVARP